MRCRIRFIQFTHNLSREFQMTTLLGQGISYCLCPFTVWYTYIIPLNRPWTWRTLVVFQLKLLQSVMKIPHIYLGTLDLSWFRLMYYQQMFQSWNLSRHSWSLALALCCLSWSITTQQPKWKCMAKLHHLWGLLVPKESSWLVLPRGGCRLRCCRRRVRPISLWMVQS